MESEGQGQSLKCPYCGSHSGKCIETRQFSFRGVFFIFRTRECFHCKYKYRTKEITDDNIVFSGRPMKPLKSKDQRENLPQDETAPNPEPQPPLQENVDRPIPDSTPEILKPIKPSKKGRPRRKYTKPVDDDDFIDQSDPEDNIPDIQSGDDFFPPVE